MLFVAIFFNGAKQMLKDFKAFIMRGNVVDMAVGVIIGAAFGKIVNSFVSDVIMPPLGILIGSADFSDIMIVLKEGTPTGPYVTHTAANAAGAVTLNIGLFLNALIQFFIIATALFMLIKIVSKLQQVSDKIIGDDEGDHTQNTPTTKECPYCCSVINIKASKCPECTADLK